MIQEIAQFNTACEDFMSGKYILVDMKINSILKLIEADKKISNIVKSCLTDYDFTNHFKLASVENENSSYLVLPTDDKNVVAFVYSILNKFKAKEIDVYGFIKQFFSNGEELTSQAYSTFVSSIILPFKDAINKLYEKRHVLVDSQDYKNDRYNKIKSTIKLITRNMDAYKLSLNEKEEFTMLLNSLYLACEKNDKNLVYSLMIGLDYFAKAHKHVKPAYFSLEECFN